MVTPVSWLVHSTRFEDYVMYYLANTQLGSYSPDFGNWIKIKERMDDLEDRLQKDNLADLSRELTGIRESIVGPGESPKKGLVTRKGLKREFDEIKRVLENYSPMLGTRVKINDYMVDLEDRLQKDNLADLSMELTGIRGFIAGPHENPKKGLVTRKGLKREFAEIKKELGRHEEVFERLAEEHRRKSVEIIKETLDAGGYSVIEPLYEEEPSILEDLREAGIDVDRHIEEGKLIPMRRSQDIPSIRLPKDPIFFLHGHFREICQSATAARLRGFYRSRKKKPEIHLLIGTASLPSPDDIEKPIFGKLSRPFYGEMNMNRVPVNNYFDWLKGSAELMRPTREKVKL